MPFGLTNAPATFQDLINDTLRELLDEGVVAYLDDILIYAGTTLKEHQTSVRDVLRRLDKRHLKLHPEKCEFHEKEVAYLGHIIEQGQVRMDPEKTRSVREWPRPCNVKQVQGFLGFVNFNQWFIKNYSLKAEPLTRLTRKDHRFDWTKECEKVYRNLVTACEKDTVLFLFAPDKEIRIETDASDLAIGACLCQLGPTGKWQPVAYHSRKMSPAEQNYDIHDKELLAIVVALQHWRTYVEGSPKTTIFTDHKNLLSFTTTKVLNRRQVRWSELLGQYKFEIKYTPGKDNGRADALSR